MKIKSLCFAILLVFMSNIGFADDRIPDLPELTSPDAADVLVIEDVDAAAAVATKKITHGNLEGSIDHTNIKNIGTNTHAQIDIFLSAAVNADNYNSLSAAVTDIGATNATLLIASSQTLTANLTIPENITLRFLGGGGITAAAAYDFTVNGPMEAGYQQIIESDNVTLKLAVNSATEIYPEWWGEFPNGYNDTAILNKAIAAADLIGSSSGVDDASIIVRPGRYYVAHDSVSTIKSNFIAPNAYFSVIDNSTIGGYIFRFDFTEVRTYASQRIVEIGTILGKDNMSNVQHYNVGVTILGGDSCLMRIGALLGLYMGIYSPGNLHQVHVGFWDVKISQIIGCDYGVIGVSGTTAGFEAGIEANIFKIEFIANTKIAISLDSSHADSITINSNYFYITSLELHMFDDLVGFWISGENTCTNTFVVKGNIVPPTGSGGGIVITANSARDNLFKLSYIDWDKINTSGGYNVFRETTNAIASASGRTEVNGFAAPTTLKWRRGDKVWNLYPDASGALGWICIASGTPGTWTTIQAGGSGITLTMKASELNDTSDPHLLTTAELHNTIITNSESTGADEWDFPARTEGWNFVFIKETNQNVALDPYGSENWYYRSNDLGYVLNGAGVAITNTTNGKSTITCFSTESAVYCTGDSGWE